MQISSGTEPEGKLTKVPIAFTEDLYEWLRDAAHLRRTSMAQVVREAVAEYRVKIDPQLSLPIAKGPE